MIDWLSHSFYFAKNRSTYYKRHVGNDKSETRIDRQKEGHYMTRYDLIWVRLDRVYIKNVTIIIIIIIITISIIIIIIRNQQSQSLIITLYLDISVSQDERDSQLIQETSDVSSPQPNSAYSPTQHKDENAQTRTNGPLSYETKRTQQVPTSVSISTSNETQSKGKDDSENGQQMFDVDWLDSILNATTRIDGANDFAVEKGQKVVDWPSKLVQGERDAGETAVQSQGTNEKVSAEDKSGTNIAEAGANREIAPIIEQGNIPTTKIFAASTGLPSENIYQQQYPSKNMNTEAQTSNVYDQGTVKNFYQEEGTTQKLYAPTTSSIAQRRAEAVKPFNATQNETSKVVENPDQVITESQSATGSTAPSQPTTKIINNTQGQTMAMSTDRSSVDAQQTGNAREQEKIILPSVSTKGSLTTEALPTVATAAAGKRTATLAPTMPPNVGTTQLPVLATTMTTSKVIAETKTTEGQNLTGSDVINPVTGSVILTEKVSYVDLKNDTEDQGAEKEQSDLLPKGPSIFYTADGEFVQTMDSYNDQRNAVSVEQNDENAAGDQSRFIGQSSEVQGQGLEARNLLGQNAEDRSLIGQSYGESATQQAYGEPSEKNVNAKEYGAADDNKEREETTDQANVLSRVQIPADEGTRVGIDHNSVGLKQQNPEPNNAEETGNSAMQKLEQRQDENEAKVRVIRTIPATMVPPLTSSYGEPLNGRDISTNAQPTYKAGTQTTGKANASPVTGDMMALNNKLGIEQVESGDYLGAPEHIAAQHAFTPQIPQQISTNGSANKTLQRIFNKIVGSDEVKDAEEEDAEMNGADLNDAETDVSDSVQQNGKGDKPQDEMKSLKIEEKNNDDTGNEEVEAELQSQQPEVTDQKSEFSEDQSVPQGKVTSEWTNQNETQVEQNSNALEQSEAPLNYDALSTEQSLKTFDQESQESATNQSSNQESKSTEQLASDQSVYTPTNAMIDHPTESANQETITATSSNVSLNSTAYSNENQNKLIPQRESLEKATQRDEIDNENYREPNTGDGDGEFVIPGASKYEINHGLEELLLHPDRIPSETVAEEEAGDENDYIEANKMVVHDDLER